MMDDTLNPLDDDARRLLANRAHAALMKAPDIVAYVRSHTTAAGAERGEVDAHFATPLRLTPTDVADRLYKRLADHVAFWAEELNTPAPTITGWRPTGQLDSNDLNGFRAGTTPDQARDLTRTLTRWLDQLELTIGAHEEADDYRTNIAAAIFRVAAAYPMAPRPDRIPSPRACGFCEQHTVAVEFFGSSFAAAVARGEFDFGLYTADERRDPKSTAGRMVLAAAEGVTVRCSNCSWSPPRSVRLSDLTKWLA